MSNTKFEVGIERFNQNLIGVLTTKQSKIKKIIPPLIRYLFIINVNANTHCNSMEGESLIK
jgi:hypothetical protein